MRTVIEALKYFLNDGEARHDEIEIADDLLERDARTMGTLRSTRWCQRAVFGLRARWDAPAFTGP